MKGIAIQPSERGDSFGVADIDPSPMLEARSMHASAGRPPMLEAYAPAKINLGLHVLRRRPDGFRDIDTVFVRIPWSDRITVRNAPDRRMTCSDPSLPVDGSNLCLKAADAWAVEWARETAGVALHLEKRVPYGAGLGSGSSDAATTLRLVDRLWATRGGEHRLSVVAAALGSDVPFFLGPPVARGTGRGEILEPLDVPSLAEFTFVVAVPSIHVATGPAYGMVTPSDAKRPDLAGIVARADLDEWRARLVNDFQRPVMAAYPGIAPVLQALDRHGAGHAGLSGSGSSVYGVFTSQAAAREAASECQALGCTAWTGGLDDAPSG